MDGLPNSQNIDLLAQKIVDLLEDSRRKVVSHVNSVMVVTYYHIGRAIVENEHGGKVRAEYGRGLLKELSQRLSKRFGKG